jgi:autotransporter-associated beta strand protein
MTATWTHAGDGNWNWDSDSYWSTGAPKLGGMTAVLGNVAANNVRLDWTGSKTIGGLMFQSNTNYTVGWPDDSLMLANDTGRAYIDVRGGSGSQSIASRLELYNNVSIRNYTPVPFTVAAGVIGTGELSLEAGPINLNGLLTSTGNIDINNGGRVTLNGTIQTPANDLNITNAPGTSGRLTVPNGASATVSTLRVGGYNGGNAVLTQTGGTISVNQWFVVGQSQTANGVFNMTGGTLNVRAQRGTSGDLEAGVFDSSSGTVNISGAASVRLFNNANIILGAQGTGGTGTFNQNGGAVTCYSDEGATVGGTGTLILGRNRSSGTYSYNLNGGTLTVPSITRFSGTGVFAFNGGTLRAAGDNASFIKGLTAAVVKGGGAFIDTAGHNVTIAQNLLDGGGGLTKNGAGTLTLSAATAYSGGTTINGGTLIAAASGALPASGGVINNASLVVTASNSVGPIAGAGTTAVTGGTLDALSLAQCALSISSGATVRLRAAPSLSAVDSLTIAAGGVLDLTNGAIRINYAPGASALSTIRGYLAGGYANGAWTGGGIGTSAADANHTLGYADSGAAVLVQYARVGDANLDGVVNFSDLLTVAQHYGQTGAGWAQGDFNYDGSVGFDDLLAFAHNEGAAPTATQLSVFTPAFQSDVRRAFAQVPAPATACLLPIAGGLLLIRRR